MEYKTLRQLDLKKGDLIEDDQGKRGAVGFIDTDSIRVAYTFGNCRHYDMDIAKYKKITAEPKLEVGQYWHHPENGDEWLVGKKTQRAYFVCECTKEGGKEGGIWEFSDIEPWDLDEFNHGGYILGRHPDNIEAEWLTLAECGPGVGDVIEIRHKEGEEYCIEEFKVLEVSETGLKIKDVLWIHFQHDARCLRIKSSAEQPEQWQPKEGETVWNKVYKNKAKLVTGQKGHIYYMFFDKDGIECISPNFERDREQFEPYTNQDKPVIDFSVAGQWLRVGETIVKTSGIHDTKFAYIYFLGDGFNEAKKVSKSFNWQLLTPEQIDPILELLKNI